MRNAWIEFANGERLWVENETRVFNRGKDDGCRESGGAREIEEEGLGDVGWVDD